jgi:hypothetical protein
VIATLLMSVGHTVEGIIAVIVIGAVVIADNFLPDSDEEKLRRWYRGQWKRRERRGSPS